MKIYCIAVMAAFLILASQIPAQGSPQKAGQSQLARNASCHIIRQIQDYSTHVQWILIEDMSHPDLPARLTQARDGGSCGQPAELDSKPRDPDLERMYRLPIVHTGDALTVLQHTPFAMVHLEAIALGPAMVGQTFRVRLKSSGLFLWVRATSAGHATLAADQIGVRW